VRAHPEFLKITSRVQGLIHNCSTKSEEFTFIGAVDPSHVPPLVGTSQISRVAMAAEFGPALFDESPKTTKTLQQPDGSIEYKSRKQLAAGGRFTTIFEAVEYTRTTHSLPLFTSTTVVKAVVRIRYPKDLLNVSLQLSTGNESGIVVDQTLWGTEWRIQEPLLPGQCILAVWNPKVQQGARDGFVSKENITAPEQLEL
jgi:hypothetical protein